mgnify:FL=1
MDKRIVDLHVHSAESDGTFTPEELVTEALHAGLCAFALTDHDTIGGIAAAKAAARKTGLTVIPGIELSCYNDDHEVHMVGLFIDETNAAFKESLKSVQDSREERNKKMIDRLREEAGFDISVEALRAYFPDAVLTRAHIARYLYERGCIQDLNVAFQKYIGDHCPYYVPREKMTPVQAIDLIHAAGGLAILAHPLLYHLSDTRLKQLMTDLKAHGLDGVEAIYSTYTAGEERRMKELAAELDLAVSGGSDFHGANKPKIHLGTGKGSLFVPYAVFEHLKSLKEAHSN